MKGVRVAVHQSSSLSDSRKLVARTRSPSLAVVSEIAPRCTTASSLRRSSQPISSAGGTTSASWRLPRLRHLPASAQRVVNHDVAAPDLVEAGDQIGPMKPAPPVTNSIRTRPAAPPFFAQARRGVQRPRIPMHWTGREGS